MHKQRFKPESPY